MIRRALYPGSFDPMTLGHADLLRRALELFDEVVVGVGVNRGKVPLFTAEERVQMIQDHVNSWPESERISVVAFQGLVVHCAEALGCRTLLRGLRTVSDFEVEYQMALTNRALSLAVETVFVMPSEKYFYVSSRLIKEVFAMGGDLSEFLAPAIAEQVRERISRQSGGQKL